MNTEKITNRLIVTDKKAFILRINPEVLKEIEAWAADEIRSINGQVEFLLRQALLVRRKNNKKKTEDKF